MDIKYLTDREKYIKSLKFLSFNELDIIKDDEFRKYIAVGTDNYKLKILEKILKGTIFSENEIKNQIEPIEDDENFFRKIEINKHSYVLLEKYSKKIDKYINIEPTVTALCEKFKIDVIDLVYPGIFNNDIKLNNLFLYQLNSAKRNFSGISKYCEHRESLVFKKATGLIATFENISKYLGLKDDEIKELIQKETKRKEKVFSKRLEISEKKVKDAIKKQEDDLQIEKDNHLIKLNELKGLSLCFDTIFSFYENPITKECLKKKNLTIYEFHHYLESKKTKIEIDIEIIQREKLRLLQNKYEANSSGNIHKMYVCEILKITPTEFKRWKADGLLDVAETHKYRSGKFHKLFIAEYFSPKFLLSITSEKIAEWRMAKKIKKPIDNELLKILKRNDIFYDGKWYKIFIVNIDNCKIKVRGEFICKINTEKIYAGAEETIIQASKNINIQSKIQSIREKIDSIWISREKVINQISLAYESKKDIKNTTFNSIFKSILNSYDEISKKQEIIEALQIDRYEKSFPLARGLNRTINIVIGPTNSGKTYQALEKLKKARSGVYLSPLRLLAIEIYDKLNLEGVPCSLITGEEHIVVEGALHTASTVEMMNTDKVLEVAIIDECQMLGDKQRGWAWTAALLGVPAQEVFAISNTPTLETLKKLFEKADETYTVFEKNRLTPLETMTELVSLDSVTRGDAIIAFSRKDVLSYATLLRKQGLKVSVIYGALSPEVRKRQSELFCIGENEVVVATDAIGMGINLPIKRILFATICKYDGVSVRTLDNSEIHQIAGRAGRFGIYDVGYVSLLNNQVNTIQKLKQVKAALSRNPSLNINSLTVAPNNWHIEKISDTLETKDIKKILIYFSALPYDSLFSCVNVDEMCKLYDLIKPYLKGFSLTEQYNLLCAPVETHNKAHVEFYKNLISKILNGIPFCMNESKLYNLTQAEQNAKNLTLFCWLSFKYKIMNTENITGMRIKISKYIEKKLIQQNTVSFSQMIEPYVRKNYRYDNYNDDDEYNNY